MKEISEAQARIYNFLRERIQTDGVPPSVREICTATGIRSTSTVHYHLKALESAGYISRDEGLNRSIRIAGENARFIPGNYRSGGSFQSHQRSLSGSGSGVSA